MTNLSLQIADFVEYPITPSLKMPASKGSIHTNVIPKRELVQTPDLFRRPRNLLQLKVSPVFHSVVGLLLPSIPAGSEWKRKVRSFVGSLLLVKQSLNALGIVCNVVMESFEKMLLHTSKFQAQANLS